jgi:UDP-glucose 4-epimerase
VVTAPAHGIVVTGAAGFLGRAVMAQLALLGLPATGLSRRPMPATQQVTDYADTPAASVIIHLAEEADRGVVNHLGDAYAEGSAAIVRKLVARAERIVYASSGTVYGDDNEEPCTLATPVVAADTYSRSKIRNELIALDAGGTAIRLSNLFGGGMSTTNVVSDIARQLGATGPVSVRDDTPVRDFLAVQDAASAIVLAATTPCTGVLNVGSGVGLTIRRVAEIALSATGQSVRGIVASQRASRRSVNVLDVAETRRRLGWIPTAAPAEQLGNYFRRGAGLGQ